VSQARSQGAAPALAPLIEVRDLRFRYEDGTQALAGVHFALYPGESVALFGANGSGKTTFVLHLNGLLHGQGRISVCGEPLTSANLSVVRRKVGLVFQDPDDQLFMPTVMEDVCFGLLNQGMAPAAAIERAREALRQVGMEWAEGKAPYQLSGGEKRRVAIAGVVVMQPEILVLDEPTTSLDPPTERELAAILNRLPQAKIVATHDVAFARAVATRAVFFENGRITGEGGVDELARLRRWESRPS